MDEDFGSPAARHRNVTIWARVQPSFGEKVVAEVPVVIPFSRAQFTASAYYASAGTSLKPSVVPGSDGAAPMDSKRKFCSFAYCWAYVPS